MDLYEHYDISNVLGYGGEATVYVSHDRVTGKKLVVKDFHEPIPGDIAVALQTYANKVPVNNYGLFEVGLHWEGGRVEALYYPFLPLYEIHWRLLNTSERLTQAIFGTYCQMQWYLMSNFEIAFTDTPYSHFMFAGDGRFYFIDYGIHIMHLDNPWGLERGMFGYAFAMLLMSLHRTNIKTVEKTPAPGYDYNKPCIHCMSEYLDVIAARHAWVADVLSEARRQNASVFLDPAFYQDLSQRFPTQIKFPRLVIGASQSLTALANFKQNWFERDE